MYFMFLIVITISFFFALCVKNALFSTSHKLKWFFCDGIYFMTDNYNECMESLTNIGFTLPDFYAKYYITKSSAWFSHGICLQENKITFTIRDLTFGEKEETVKLTNLEMQKIMTLLYPVL